MEVTKVKKKEFTDRLIGKIYGIEVIYRGYTSITSEVDPDDEWSRPSTETQYSIDGFEVHKREADGYELQTLYEPQHGVDYYLLYAVYSTGDSFGHDDGGGIEFIGFYTDSEKWIGEENQRRIDTNSYDSGSYNITLLSPRAKEFKLYPPWTGYFEHLDYTDLQIVRRIK